MKRTVCFILCMVIVAAMNINGFTNLSTGLPQWDFDYLKSEVTSEAAEGFTVANGAVPVFLDSIKYNDADTKVFAWYAIPEGATKESPVPAVVLVHGGGGTASSAWVKMWLDKGYAAISIDTCGNTGDMGTSVEKTRHAYAGPAGCAEVNVRQIRNGDAIENQWAYHAVAAIMRANTFISSFDCVDPNRVGITGISWGGYLTEIAAAVDNRFAFAVPVYGCGYLYEDNTILTSYLNNSTPQQAAQWRENWDPSLYVGNISCPTLFLTGNTDFAFPMDCYKKTYSLIEEKNRWLCVKNGLNHSHTDGQTQKEIYAFADYAVNSGEAFIKETESGGTFPEVWANFEGEISKAEVIFTKDSGKWQDRTWESAVAQISSDGVSAQLPAKTTACYFNVYDSRGNISSSTLFENEMEPDSYASESEINAAKDVFAGTENISRYAFGENSLFKYSGNKEEALALLDSARSLLNKEDILKSRLSAVKEGLGELSRSILNSERNAAAKIQLVREMRCSADNAIMYDAKGENKKTISQSPPFVGDRRGVYITNKNRTLLYIDYKEMNDIQDNNAYVFKCSFRQSEKASALSIASLEWGGTNGANEIFGITSDGTDIYLRCADNAAGFSGSSGFTRYKEKLVENYEPNTWYDFTVVFDRAEKRLYPFVNGVQILNGKAVFFAGAGVDNTGSLRLDFNSSNASGMYVSGIGFYNCDTVNGYVKIMDELQKQITVSSDFSDCRSCADKYCLPQEYTGIDSVKWSSDDFDIQNGYGDDESSKLFAYTTYNDSEKVGRLMVTLTDGENILSSEHLITVSGSYYEKSRDDSFDSYSTGNLPTAQKTDGYYLFGGIAAVVPSSEKDLSGNPRGNVLRLDGTSSNRLAFYTSPQKPSVGIRIVEADVKISDTETAKEVRRSQINVQDREGKCSMDLTLDKDGVLRVNGQYLIAAKSDTWYRITLIFDFDKRVCRALVNGNPSSTASNIELPYAMRNVGRVVFDARNCGEVFYDNFSIRSSADGLYQYLYNGELPGSTKLTDANGNNVTEVQGGTYLGGKVTVKNASKDTMNVAAILALYDEDNRLIKTSIKEISCKNDSITESEFISEEYLTVPENGTYTAKIFLLNSLTDLKPLAK